MLATVWARRPSRPLNHGVLKLKSRDQIDLFGGLLMLAIGVFVALFAQRYQFGTPARMGPGFFPQLLGWILVALGLVITVSAWFRSGEAPTVQWKNALFAVSALLAFAVLLRPGGLVLATFSAAFVASMADNQSTWIGRLLISAGVTALAAMIFVGGLRMSLPLWPFSY